MPYGDTEVTGGDRKSGERYYESLPPDMPSAPARLSWVVMRLPAGRMQVYYETAARHMEAGQKTKKG